MATAYDENRLALHHAAVEGNLPLHNRLIGEGYPINCVTACHRRTTPLIHAVLNGNTPCMIRLLENGAKPTPVTLTRDFRKLTILQVACRDAPLEAVE